MSAPPTERLKPSPAGDEDLTRLRNADARRGWASHGRFPARVSGTENNGQENRKLAHATPESWS